MNRYTIKEQFTIDFNNQAIILQKILSKLM
jgi:hypothetical protein